MQRCTTPNVLRIYAQATEGEREYGENWYPVAHKAAARIARTTGFTVRQIAGVLSALSPSNRWHQNIVDAERFAIAARDGKSQPSASTYPIGRAKAWDILTEVVEDPEEVFTATQTSMKTHAFFLSIAGPFSSVDLVVVDGHAWNIATNNRKPLGEVGTITPKRYKEASRCYVRAAMQAGVTPQAMQATCWLAWRRLASPQTQLEDILLTTERM